MLENIIKNYFEKIVDDNKNSVSNIDSIESIDKCLC